MFNRNKSQQNTKLHKMLKKIFVSLLIMVVVLGVNKLDFEFSKSISSGIKYILNYEYDFKKHFEKINIAKIANKYIDSPFLKNMFNSKTEVQTMSPVTQTSMIPPVQGKITSEFGPRLHPILKEVRQHNGIDIKAEEGTDIMAAMDGTVARTWVDEEYGNVIKIKHPNQIETLYAHCSKVLVEVGEKVKKGDIIGKVGSTGLAESPHLHFELWIKGEPVDPLQKLVTN